MSAKSLTHRITKATLWVSCEPKIWAHRPFLGVDHSLTDPPPPYRDCSKEFFFWALLLPPRYVHLVVSNAVCVLCYSHRFNQFCFKYTPSYTEWKVNRPPSVASIALFFLFLFFLHVSLGILIRINSNCNLRLLAMGR